LQRPTGQLQIDRLPYEIRNVRLRMSPKSEDQDHSFQSRDQSPDPNHVLETLSN